MIPRIIHYIWLGGGNKPKSFPLVFNSWSVFAEGFKLREWTELDIKEFNLPPYFYKCVKERKWAFASDVLRFYILEKYGGVYLDVDQLLVKGINTDELLCNHSFLAKYHEVDDYFGFGFIGSVKHSRLTKDMISFYEGYTSSNDIIVNRPGSEVVIAITKSSPQDIKIFDQEYFYPLNETWTSSRTYSKHLSNRSWIPVWKKVMYKIPYYLFLKKSISKMIPTFLKRKLFKVTY